MLPLLVSRLSGSQFKYEVVGPRRAERTSAWGKGKCKKNLWKWLQKCIFCFLSFREEVRRKAEAAV